MSTDPSLKVKFFPDIHYLPIRVIDVSQTKNSVLFIVFSYVYILPQHSIFS